MFALGEEGFGTLSLGTQLRILVGAMISLAGFTSVILRPVPWQFLCAAAGAGVVAGALLWIDGVIPAAIALVGVFFFGVDGLADRLLPGRTAVWWQPHLIAGSTLLLTYVAPTVVRSIRRQWTAQAGPSSPKKAL